MLTTSKNKGPRACLTCAKAKSRCVPGPVPNVCERCQRLGKQCGNQTPAPPRRRRPDSAAGSAEAAVAVNAALPAAARARANKPTRVSELERRLEDLTTRLETVSRQPPTAVAASTAVSTTAESAASASSASSDPALAPPIPAFVTLNRTMPYYPLTHIFAQSNAPSDQRAVVGSVHATLADRSPSSGSNSNSNSQSNLRSGSGSGSASEPSPSTGVSLPDLDTDDLPVCNFFPPNSLRRPPTPPSTKAMSMAAGSLHGVGVGAGSEVWPQPAEAEMMLREYRMHLLPLLPFVVVPPHVPAGRLQAERPLTWMGCMMAACHQDGRRQIAMGNQLLDKVVGAALLQPKRSTDVVHALHLLIAWFHYNINSFQLNNLLFLARGLTVSLGLSEAAPAAGGRYTSEALEKMRSFAGTFYLVTVATTNKKPDTMMNTPYLETCCQALAQQMEYPHDGYLAQLVRSQQLCQAIVVAFSLRNAGIQNDLSVSFLVANFSQQIAQFRAQLPETIVTDLSLRGHIYMAELLLYEIALQEQSAASSLSLPAAERLNMLSRCMQATRDYMQSRFAEPVADQPRAVCLTSFDFIYAFLTALKLMTFQMPGWDPRHARQELAFDQVVNRQIFDMQQLAERRNVRGRAERDRLDSGGSFRDAAKPGDNKGGERHDPFQRLAIRLGELKAMISRELDRLPSGTATPAGGAGIRTGGTTSCAVAAVAAAAEAAGSVLTELAEPPIESVEVQSAPPAPPAPPAPAAPIPTDILPDAALDDAAMLDMGDFDIGMIDAAPAIFSFAGETIDYMQNLDGSWPELFPYLDVDMGTPTFDAWEM